MKNIKIILGSMYGDEGKGFTTDYFCNTFDSNVLNVRFNGTGQAGHTVERNGIKHVFKSFGAGMLQNNVKTLLASTFVLEPMVFNIEANTLAKLFKCKREDFMGLVYIDKNCKVILPWDKILNMEKEEKLMKTDSNHGSCGYGLYESIVRGKKYKDITIGEFADMNCTDIVATLIEFRDSYYLDKVSDVFGDELIHNFATDIINIITECNIIDETDILNQYENIVFEGAQGLSLDWHNVKYAPHLTASKTDSTNPIMLIDKINDYKNIEVVYVTRTYHTRHGKGYLYGEISSSDMLKYDLKDETNVPNKFQGTLRYGYFDIIDFTKNINKDYLLYLKVTSNITYSIMITHSKNTDNQILIDNNKSITISNFIKIIKNNIKINQIYVGDLDKVVKHDL